VKESGKVAAGETPGVLRGMWTRALGSDLWYSFRRSPVAVGATLTAMLIFAAVTCAPWITHDPFDLSVVDLMDAAQPPVWADGGIWKYPLGSDDQGRSVLATILYGTRISLVVGVLSVLFAMAVGVPLGLVAGFAGGPVGVLIMRLADIQLSFPAILVALLIDGIARSILPHELHERLAFFVLIFAIGISNWVHYARAVRASTLVERNKEYVQAAWLVGTPPVSILVRHILPNVVGPILVLATLGLATAIISEATLSFLGVGLPPTQPSLGTLMRIGNEFLFSGQWWMTIFPGIALILVALSVNLLGDWLRDALNPKLR
jgi:peptide/nickel transport system permease protein